jgi:hypothetical protein
MNRRMRKANTAYDVLSLLATISRRDDHGAMMREVIPCYQCHSTVIFCRVQVAAMWCLLLACSFDKERRGAIWRIRDVAVGSFSRK